MAPRLNSSSSAAGSGAPQAAESFLNGGNSIYVEEMFRVWSEDPSKVHSSWDAFFRTGSYQPPPGVQRAAPATSFAAATATGGASSAGSDVAAAIHVIRAYQDRGHQMANLDPLGLRREALPLGIETEVSDVDPALYGFDVVNDPDRPLHLEGMHSASVTGLLRNADLNGDGVTTVSELIEFLKTTYCGNIGFEYTHIRDKQRMDWCMTQVEVHVDTPSKETTRQILERLDFATTFESTLATKFGTAKRFGLEGLETLIPGMKAMIDIASMNGAEDFVIGMAHRGRLNVLSNVIRKPMEMIFKEFDPSHSVGVATSEEDWSGSGDVKYHLGTSFTRAYPDGRVVNLSLMANPSHLEAVNPLVMGKSRAKMHYKDDATGKSVVPVLLHGDAAFCGQGVVYESMQMTKLDKFGTGGTIHIITNNQVGFTADPWQSRSTQYASDLGKAFEAPIFHVNADDPEAVVRAFELATMYRQTFNNDVVVDLIGYRKNGHNEVDEPAFTQPLMYERIRKHPTALQQYRESLVAQGRLSEAEVQETKSFVEQCFEDAFKAAPDYVPSETEWVDDPWKSMKNPNEFSPIQSTGVPIDELRRVAATLTRLPDGFSIHRRLGNRILKAKQQAIEAESGLDWATAEALAFGTLLLEGTHVRLTGQDAQRGTFSHRHAVWVDQKTAHHHVPLNEIDPQNQAEFVIANSHLSEFGVLGFELGYSLERPDHLVLWEGQFGDFVNGAQIIIDQFISSGEAKWLTQSGLVMLLPHQYQGQGPEHSSARIERFLQSCDEDPDDVPDLDEESTMQIQRHNWQIVNCSTPANYFHVLRRQQKRDFRKPLVVAAPKGLLGDKRCVSDMSEMAEGTRFQRLIPERRPDDIVADDKVRRVVFCSGAFYYDLVDGRASAGVDDVAIVSVEQVAPWPFDLVAEQISKYPNAEVVWAQEEPKNMGTW